MKEELATAKDHISEMERYVEEYTPRLLIASEDLESFKRCAERLNCTPEALLQIFINDLTCGRENTGIKAVEAANKWYEKQGRSWIIRYEDNELLSVYGTHGAARKQAREYKDVPFVMN